MIKEEYFSMIRKIAEDTVSGKEKAEQPQGKTAYLLNFADDSHYECLMQQYGGREHLKAEYPRLYAMMEHTRQVHQKKAPERMLSQGPGLNDYIYIYELGQSEKELFGSGAATLTDTADRLFITLSIYDGEERVGYGSDFFHGSRRGHLELNHKPVTVSSGKLTGILHVTWTDPESDTLRSGVLTMSNTILVTNPISDVNIIHPRTSPGRLPAPITEEGYTGQEALHTEMSEPQKLSQEFINVCYARNAEKGERVDYPYPYGLKDGEQTIYLDIRGEIVLEKAEFDKMIRTDIGLDTPYGAVMPQITSYSKYFLKTSTGVKFGFPTCWKTPIPGGKLAGRDLCDLTVAITFRCKDKKDDYTVWISSLGQSRPNVSYQKEISRIKLNWGCLAADTQIRTKDGTKKICEIHAGDKVLNEHKEEVTVLDVMSGYESVLWTVQSEGGDEIRVTDTHPFMTKEGMKAAIQLMETDEVLQDDGQYHKMKFRFEKYYGGTVYNLVFQDSQNVIANGYIVGDHEKQQEAMHRAAVQEEVQISQELVEECEKLKREFGGAKNHTI